MAAPQNSSNLRLIIVGVCAVGVAAVVAVALLQQTPPAPVALPSAVAVATPKPTTAPASDTSMNPTAQTSEPAAKAATPEPGSPAWENTIDQVLKSNVSEAQMAQMLIGILPTLPEDGQIEAANHISNLLPDSAYSSVKPLLLNTSLPESVLSVFFTDLMNRDDTTKLNAFLDVAQITNHPFHDEALSDLQIYVGDDFGTDWSKWKTAVAQYLKTASEQQ